MGDDNPAWHDQAQTANETAGQEGNIREAGTDLTPAANSTANGLIFTNTLGFPVLLELCMISFDGAWTDDMQLLFEIQDENGFQVFTVEGSPQNYPVTLDPAMRIQENWSIQVFADNNSSSSRDVSFRVIMRELD